MKGVTVPGVGYYVIPPNISIHTPVKGVTGFDVELIGFEGISIHTPVKGVTVSARVSSQTDPISIHTPVKGVTAVGMPGARVPRDISIHTPVKGVTSQGDRAPRPGFYFNPHTREGCDVRY